MKNFDKAFSDFEKAIQLNPERKDKYFLIATLSGIRNFNEAVTSKIVLVLLIRDYLHFLRIDNYYRNIYSPACNKFELLANYYSNFFCMQDTSTFSKLR